MSSTKIDRAIKKLRHYYDEVIMHGKVIDVELFEKYYDERLHGCEVEPHGELSASGARLARHLWVMRRKMKMIQDGLGVVEEGELVVDSDLIKRLSDKQLWICPFDEKTTGWFPIFWEDYAFYEEHKQAFERTKKAMVELTAALREDEKRELREKTGCIVSKSKSGISIEFDEMVEESARTLGVPVFEPLPEGVFPLLNANPIIGVCGQCGMKVRRINRTKCNNKRCPTPMAWGGE